MTVSRANVCSTLYCILCGRRKEIAVVCVMSYDAAAQAKIDIAAQTKQ